jgi:hypothetical protein
MTESGLITFIPENVLLEQELSGEDKFILSLIHSELKVDSIMLGKMLNKSEQAVKRITSRLSKRGFLKIRHVDGKFFYSKVAKRRKILQRKGVQNASVSPYELLRNSYETTNNININNNINSNMIYKLKGIPSKKRKYVPKTVQPYLDHWFIRDLRVPGEETKQFSKDIEALKRLLTGKFFEDKAIPHKYWSKSFSLTEWKLSVDRFAMIARNPDYLPTDKGFLSKFTISDFLYNAYSKGGPHSFFLEMLDREPKRIKRLEDDHPEITERFKFLYNEYRKEVHNDYGYRPDTQDNEKFAQATKRTVQLFEGLKKDIKNYHVEFSRTNSVPDFVWAAVLHDTSGFAGEISPGYLCSNITFEKRIPNYLNYKRIL